MIIDELFEAPQQCPECGGISFSNLILAEKKDACYHKVKASAKVWPSAYASGRLVQCRKKGAANYGNKSEGVAEDSLNELDIFAPVTTYVRLANGTYVAANWRRNQNLSTASNSASFIDIKPLAPAAAKQLGLDQRLNDPEKKYTGATTIASGGPIQASGPLADRTINVVDIRDPKAAKDSGVPDTLFGKIAQWAQQQGQKQPGVAEGLGDQGNFAGDTPVNIGSDTVKRLVVGDIVSYLGQKSKILAQSKDRKYSRITIASDFGGTTKDVLTSDLKRLGQGVAEGSLEEGVNDPHIFKAIAMIGPMGAGKSTIARQLVGGSGLRSLNLDNFNELLIKQGKVAGGNLTPDQLERSWQLTQAQKGNWVDGRLGLLIDGSGRNVEGLVKPLLQLEALGYDTMVILVNVSLETSLQRQQSRAAQQAQQYGTGRNVPADLAKSSYDQIQQNIPKLQQLYGNKLLIINNEGAVDLTQEKTIVDRFLSAPPSKPAAVEWIKSHGASQGQQLDKRLAQQQRQQSSAQRAPTYTQQGMAEGYVPINIYKGPTIPASEPKKVKKDYTPKYDPQVHGPVYDLEWQRQQNEKRWYNVVRKSDGKVLNPEPIKGQTAAEEFRKQNGLGGGNADLVQVSTLRFHATGIDASGKRVVSEPLLSMKDVRNFYKQHGINQFASTTDLTTTDEGSVAEGVMYGAENLNVGDDVIISGDVELNGATGVIDSFGQDKRFVVVNLFNHGPHSFHSSDVSANDYDRDEHDDDMLETRRGQIPMTLNPGETDNLEPENLAGFRALPAYKQGQAAQQKAGKQLIQKSPYTFQSDQDWAYRQGAFDTQQAAMFANFGKSKPLTIEGGEQQKGADYRDPKEVDYDDEYDAMVARVKKLAGLGPMKTVYDPNKRVYRNMPTAVQPKK